ncbi:MAG: rhodanese-like domain-containing protein [Gammaproteobacteria bacterium]|nr:rhodanese-like domain-containing protein [Gammaproteobacteria bacterium]
MLKINGLSLCWRQRLAGWYLLLLLVSLPLTAEKVIAPEDLTGVMRVTTQEVVNLILATPNLVIIDVRHRENYAEGHIEGAKNHLDTLLDAAVLAGYLESKETPVIFYCNGPDCLRSSHAASLAYSLGYQRVYWYRDGWSGWLKERLPISYP